ncbi:MAG TPA: hypothetical protein VEJ47_11505 [Candidatus Eremiobacteraceae bacterium]|nr:hypothetical protein [Candidatus Eremiobacteraceae bacterium]
MAVPETIEARFEWEEEAAGTAPTRLENYADSIRVQKRFDDELMY